MSDTAVQAKPVEVGDIFYSSWGYDQTNVDFYEVVGLTPSGKSVKVRRIGNKYVSGDTWTGTVIADPDHVLSDKVVTKRLRKGYQGIWSFNVASYADAYLWDGRPKHCSGYA